MKNLLRLAFKELLNQKIWSLIFILNLSIGLAGFLLIDIFKSSIQKNLAMNAKANLAGDISVSVRRQFTQNEVKKINEINGNSELEISRVWELFSMVSSEKRTQLIQLKGIDEKFPLYGKVDVATEFEQSVNDSKSLLSKDNTSDQAWSSIFVSSKVIVSPELLVKLEVHIGDEIRIGKDKFIIAGVIKKESSQGFRISQLTPKIYISRYYLEKSPLVGFGTTMFDKFLFKTKTNQSEKEIDDLKDVFSRNFLDPAIRTETSIEAAEESGGVFKYLSDYLGLVTLIAVFLSFLGSGYLYQYYLKNRIYSMAIMNSLGMQLNRAFKLSLLQLLILGLFSSFLSSFFCFLLIPVFQRAIGPFLPSDFQILFSQRGVLIAFILGTFGSLVLGLPFLQNLKKIQTRSLLSEFRNMEIPVDWKSYLWILPGILIFIFLAILQSNSFKVGSLFVLAFILSGGVLAGLALLIFSLIPTHFMPGSKTKNFFKANWPNSFWWIRHSFISLQRKKGSKISLVLALGLGTLLINILPQIKTGLLQNLESSQGEKLPKLFLFDIQIDQIDSLKNQVEKMGFELNHISPLIRARILKINDQSFEKADAKEALTREEEREVRFRNRGVNLTFRENLSAAETLSEEFGVSINDGIPPISLEKGFAQTLKIKLGDIISFDIQGFEMKARVMSFRKVKWNSFQPNFFISFKPGVLDDAPKTFLASIAEVNPQEVDLIQRKLGNEFPNISVIDVDQFVQKILEISDQMSWSLEIMAYLSLFAGFIILFSVVSVDLRQRMWDLNMLKILGAPQKSLGGHLLFEYGFVVLIAGFIGSILSIGMSYGICYWLFEGIFKISGVDLIFILMSLLIISLSIVWFSAQKIVKEKPLRFLQGRGD